MTYGTKIMIAGAGVPALGSAVLCLDSNTMRLSRTTTLIEASD